MSPGPFLKGSRCICCPNCISDDSDRRFCDDLPVPKYISLRLSAGFGNFPSEVPITWDEGAHNFGTGTWLYYFIAQWLKKHTEGEGPDIVLTGGVSASRANYSGTIQFASMHKASFSSANIADVANDDSPQAAPNIYNLSINLSVSEETMTLKIGIEGSTGGFFESTIAGNNCSWMWATANQPYIALPNENDVDPEYAGVDTGAALINARAWGGTAYIRPCSVRNFQGQGHPWYRNNLHVASGSYLPCVKTSFSAPISASWCRTDYPYAGRSTEYSASASPTVTHDEGVASGSWDAGAGFTFFEQLKIACGGADDGESSGITIKAWNCELGYMDIGNVIYAYPWANSGFDPITDSIANGATLTLWGSQTDGYANVGTITIPALSSTGTCCPVMSDATKCLKWTDSSGFKVKNFQSSLPSPASSPTYWVASIAGFPEITADNMGDFQTAMRNYYPAFSITGTAHGTSPLLSEVQISGISGSWTLVDDTDTQRTMVAC